MARVRPHPPQHVINHIHCEYTYSCSREGLGHRGYCMLPVCALHSPMKNTCTLGATLCSPGGLGEVSCHWRRFKVTVILQKSYTQHHSEVKLLCSSHGHLSASAPISGDKKNVTWVILTQFSGGLLWHSSKLRRKILLHPFVCLWALLILPTNYFHHEL